METFMYISENIYYLLKELGFLFLSFSYSAFLELMRRTSSQRKWAEFPHGITGMILRTWFALSIMCEDNSRWQSSCQKIVLPLQTANHSANTLWWNNSWNGEVTATKQQHPHTRTREIHFLDCFFFFLYLHAWVQTHWESDRAPEGPTPLN